MYTVYKSRTYSGSLGLGLKLCTYLSCLELRNFTTTTCTHTTNNNKNNNGNNVYNNNNDNNNNNNRVKSNMKHVLLVAMGTSFHDETNALCKLLT